MKNGLCIALIAMLACIEVNAGNKESMTSLSNKDSIIVTFGEKTRLIIYGENRNELDKIMKYDINTLLKDLSGRLKTTDSDTTFLKEEFNGNDYLKDKSAVGNDKDYVRIGLRGIHIKDGSTEVTINSSGMEVKDQEGSESTDSEYRRTGKRFYKSHFGSSPRKGFNIALGLNTYGSNKATAGYNKADYDLRPFGSRFVSLGYIASTTVAKGKNARLHLDFGLDFSWYNLMFDGNNTVTKTADRVAFPTMLDADGKEIQLQKSKLVVPDVNLSFMPTVSFPRSFVSYISAGVYGGYRLGGYTKTRVEGSKDKDHVRMNYHLTDIRYGLSAEVGIRNFPDLFVNYDMNKLFVDNRGPSVNMLSFGFRLLN